MEHRHRHHSDRTRVYTWDISETTKYQAKFICTARRASTSFLYTILSNINTRKPVLSKAFYNEKAGHKPRRYEKNEQTEDDETTAELSHNNLAKSLLAFIVFVSDAFLKARAAWQTTKR